jgi:spermidine synthase
MKTPISSFALCFAALLGLSWPAPAQTVFEKYSPYHHVQVVDEGDSRMLSFNGTRETRMSKRNPLQGHFEYIEYFHMPWIWNHDIKRVLMMGLGGGSAQRAYQHYYTNVSVDTVELDPVVVAVAKEYFGVVETPQHKIYNDDGRVFLRRTANKYDLILMDAYTTSRYGSSIPPHLITKEFFTLAKDHLTKNGVLAYNVIGVVDGWQGEMIAAAYRTMKEVFPQVYMFKAESSYNTVFVVSLSPERFDSGRVQRDAAALVSSGKVKYPGFRERLRSFVATPPRTAASAKILTDDRAPMEGLMRSSGKSE